MSLPASRNSSLTLSSGPSAKGVLAYRYPMQDMEIQNGGQLTVRESQMAVFVNEGRSRRRVSAPACTR